MGVLPFHVTYSDIKESMEDWPTYSQEQHDPNVWILNRKKSDPKKKVEVKGSKSTRVCGSTRLSAKKEW